MSWLLVKHSKFVIKWILYGIDGSNQPDIYSIGQWYDIMVGSEQLGIAISHQS